MKTHETLGEDLARDPPDVGAWSVYADKLIEEGDPFAEIVARAVRGSSSARALQAARERRDPAYWPGSLLSFGYDPRVDWRMGLWSEVGLHLGQLEDDDTETLAALQDLCAHPAARTLRLLSLSFEAQMDWEDHIYHLSALAGLDVPLSLDLSARFDGCEALAELPRLRFVKIGLSRGDRLPRLPLLRGIDLEWSHGEDHLGWLGEMTSLERLSLVFDSPPADLSALSSLPLASLSFSWRGRPARTGWNKTLSIPTLEHIGLSGFVGDRRGLVPALEGLPRLRSMHVEHWSLSLLPASLCQQMRALSLSYAEEGSLRALPRFGALERLQLLSSLPSGDLLRELSSLSVLSLSYLDEAPQLDGLHLDALEVTAGRFPRHIVERLLALGSLRQLRLDVAPDRDLVAQMARLGEIEGLQVLDLSRCLALPEHLRWRFEGDELPWALSELSRM